MFCGDPINMVLLLLSQVAEDLHSPQADLPHKVVPVNCARCGCAWEELLDSQPLHKFILGFRLVANCYVLAQSSWKQNRCMKDSSRLLVASHQSVEKLGHPYGQCLCRNCCSCIPELVAGDPIVANRGCHVDICTDSRAKPCFLAHIDSFGEMGTKSERASREPPDHV